MVSDSQETVQSCSQKLTDLKTAPEDPASTVSFRPTSGRSRVKIWECYVTVRDLTVPWLIKDKHMFCGVQIPYENYLDKLIAVVIYVVKADGWVRVKEKKGSSLRRKNWIMKQTYTLKKKLVTPIAYKLWWPMGTIISPYSTLPTHTQQSPKI